MHVFFFAALSFLTLAACVSTLKPNPLSFKNPQSYAGSYVDGLREGSGKAVYENSAILSYEGQWENDLPEGVGAVQYRNGEIRTGRFEEGLREGDFLLVDAKGQMWAEVYEDDRRVSIRKIENNEFAGARVLDVEEGEGFILKSFDKGSVLYRLGFREGDRVIDVGGRRVPRGSGSEAMVEIMNKAGEGVNVMVLREGSEVMLRLSSSSSQLSKS